MTMKMFELIKYNSRHKEEGKSMEVEAEFKAGIDFLEHPAFIVKRDGSLLGYGLEFVSKEPTSSDKLLNNFKDLVAQPSFGKQYRKSDRASIHVHVNIQNWTKQELFTVLAAYYAVEHTLFNFIGEARQSNLFCLPLSDAEGGLLSLKRIWEEKFDFLKSNFRVYKYSALNVGNISTLGTIEFRQMKGTADPEDIRIWLGLIDSIIESRHRYQSMEQVLNDFNADKIAFTKKLFGRYFRYIDSPNLAQQLEENYSPLVDLVDYPNKPKTEKIKYYFKSALDLDDLEYNEYLKAPPKHTEVEEEVAGIAGMGGF